MGFIRVFNIIMPTVDFYEAGALDAVSTKLIDQGNFSFFLSLWYISRTYYVKTHFRRHCSHKGTLISWSHLVREKELLMSPVLLAVLLSTKGKYRPKKESSFLFAKNLITFQWKKNTSSPNKMLNIFLQIFPFSDTVYQLGLHLTACNRNSTVVAQ